MSGEAAPLQFAPTLPAEEAARANLYGLLARLFYAPPDAELLAAIAGADEIVAEQEGGRAFALAWRDLKLAAAQADAAAVADEYDTLFVGTGRAPVSLYAGAYLAKSEVDNPLVEIRGFLAAHGFARRQSVHEPEDHVALLCEVMRHLIAQEQAVLADQQSFFARFLQPCVEPLCKAIERSERAHVYKQIAMYMRRFLDIEAEAFRM
jgi:TorA maturation chaperone TorD